MRRVASSMPAGCYLGKKENEKPRSRCEKTEWELTTWHFEKDSMAKLSFDNLVFIPLFAATIQDLSGWYTVVHSKDLTWLLLYWENNLLKFHWKRNIFWYQKIKNYNYDINAQLLYWLIVKTYKFKLIILKNEKVLSIFQSF